MRTATAGPNQSINLYLYQVIKTHII